MTISLLNDKSAVLETRYVWGVNIEETMKHAMAMEKHGNWQIQGNPAPMTWNGRPGMGVSITRVNYA